MNTTIQDEALVDRLRRRLSKIFSKKKLTEYFNRKGYEDFDEYVYPPVLQDMPVVIPELRNKVEITPFSERIDPTSGLVEIGWNLFVLGTNRSFVGYSYHNSAQDLNREHAAIAGNNLPHKPKKRVVDIIEFIVETLGREKDGLLDPADIGSQINRINVDGYHSHNMQTYPQALPSGTGFGYERPQTVN